MAPKEDDKLVLHSVTLTGSTRVSFPLAQTAGSAMVATSSEDEKRLLRDLVAWYNERHGTHYEVRFR